MNVLIMDFEKWDSGITDYAFASAAGLSAKNHNVIFAGLKNCPPIERAWKEGVKTAEFEKTSGLLFLLKVIKENGITVLNPHDGKSHFLCFLARLIKGKKIKIVRSYADARPVKKHALLWKYTDLFIAAAEFIKRDFMQKGLVPEKVKVVYRGIRMDEVERRIKKKNSGGKPLRISIVGRLDPVKGHKYFLKAAAFLAQKFPDAAFSVIGAEKNVKIEELKKESEALGLKNIRFEGFAENVYEEMAASDIGVIASVGSEAVSRVALEWMACGVPVVATKVGCLPELIQDGASGLIVPPADFESIAFAVSRLLSDAAFRQSIAESALSRAENLFSYEKFVDATEDILLSL